MYKNCTFLNTLRIVKTLTITFRPKDSGNNVPVNGTAVQNWTGREIIVLLCNIHNEGAKRDCRKCGSPKGYVRFFTHVLGHSGWSHFMGNASYILLLGPMLEEKYGSAVLVKVIVITAVITALVNYIFFPGIALLGASGVVFAFIILTSFTGFRSGEIPLTFLLIAVIFIGQQIYEGAFIKDDISHLSHIIGGAVGAVVGYFWNRKK